LPAWYSVVFADNYYLHFTDEQIDQAHTGSFLHITIPGRGWIFHGLPQYPER
jgi:hypothetical protein